MAKPIIFGDRIEITYNLGQENEFKANKGATIEIYDQEYIILFGTSGSGKSTLMHILGALDTPSSGTYFLDGKDVSKLAIPAILVLSKCNKKLTEAPFHAFLGTSIFILITFSSPFVNLA